jgi:hypothetical protein
MLATSPVGNQLFSSTCTEAIGTGKVTHGLKRFEKGEAVWCALSRYLLTHDGSWPLDPLLPIFPFQVQMVPTVPYFDYASILCPLRTATEPGAMTNEVIMYPGTINCHQQPFFKESEQPPLKRC